MPHRQSSEHLNKEHTDSDAEYREKIDIIVSIKMQEMVKKLGVLAACENLFESFDAAKVRRDICSAVWYPSPSSRRAS